MSATPSHYAVLGNPIAHSQSPYIHSEFAKATHQAMIYERLEVPLADFVATVRQLQDSGSQGCNVTVPFKEEAWQLAEQRSKRAERAGAVNTLVFKEDGQIYGDNTDGSGLLRDLLQNLGLELAGTRILLIGAGGAARGVLLNLLESDPAELFIANRTIKRAQNLLDIFGQDAPEGLLRCGGFQDIRGQYDLIINATSAGLQEQAIALPESCLSARVCCYDMVYGKRTAFMQWASKQQAHQIADGLGMLVEQAADAFLLWRGIRPDTKAVLQQLRNR